MENIIRVIRYRELPPDIRFFMAYTALHGFAAELGLGIPLSTHTNENVRMWEGFKKYWHIFLLNLTPNMRDYVDKLVLTRHHFAHRSKADENVLESFEEYSEAYAYIMVVIKIMFIDAAGLPKAQWTAMLEHWSYRLQGAFKPLVPGRKSKIETIWFFEPSP